VRGFFESQKRRSQELQGEKNNGRPDPTPSIPIQGRNVLFVQTKKDAEGKHYALGSTHMHCGQICSVDQTAALANNWGCLAHEGALALLGAQHTLKVSLFKVYALSDKHLFVNKVEVSVDRGCVTWVRVSNLVVTTEDLPHDTDA